MQKPKELKYSWLNFGKRYINTIFRYAELISQKKSENFILMKKGVCFTKLYLACKTSLQLK